MENVWIDIITHHKINSLIYANSCTLGPLHYKIYVLLVQYLHRLPPGLRSLIDQQPHLKPGIPDPLSQGFYSSSTYMCSYSGCWFATAMLEQDFTWRDYDSSKTVFFPWEFSAGEFNLCPELLFYVFIET